MVCVCLARDFTKKPYWRPRKAQSRLFRWVILKRDYQQVDQCNQNYGKRECEVCEDAVWNKDVKDQFAADN